MSRINAYSGNVNSINLKIFPITIKTVYHFVDSNLGFEISSKKEELTEKDWECFGKMTYLGGGRVCLGD